MKKARAFLEATDGLITEKPAAPETRKIQKKVINVRALKEILPSFDESTKRKLFLDVPVDYQAALKLRYLDEKNSAKTSKQIADENGLSQGTFTMRQKYGLTAMANNAIKALQNPAALNGDTQKVEAFLQAMNLECNPNA